ncbi:MAG: Smr/MutS family protein [Clostridiales bacterium]|nr:Smr/MutS family protein [Clostridiales bacterium]MBR5974149.1 Smr/MutS family protein [Clostridiales bacterium]
MAARIINIKEGMPKVDVATRKLRLELNTMRRVGVNQVKIIHGYGSTGKGGVIKSATHEVLRTMQSEGKISLFCPGEQFGPFETLGKSIVEKCPSFRNDPDWAKANDGITVVLIR